MVAKQPGGWRSTIAHFMSGENPEPQFVSDAFVTPETPYDQLPLGGPSKCPKGYPSPGHTFLQPFDASTETFTANANYATNMGFAVWVPPGEGFTNGNSYLQLLSPGAGPAYNPGQTSPNGTKSVEWPYNSMLLSQFQPPTRNRTSRFGNVVVLAIACLADNIPAISSTAAVVGYHLSATGAPVITKDYPGGFDADRLARAACEAST